MNLQILANKIVAFDISYLFFKLVDDILHHNIIFHFDNFCDLFSDPWFECSQLDF